MTLSSFLNAQVLVPVAEPWWQTLLIEGIAALIGSGVSFFVAWWLFSHERKERLDADERDAQERILRRRAEAVGDIVASVRGFNGQDFETLVQNGGRFERAMMLLLSERTDDSRAAYFWIRGKLAEVNRPDATHTSRRFQHDAIIAMLTAWISDEDSEGAITAMRRATEGSSQ